MLRFTFFFRSLGKKSALLGQKQCFLGRKCTITWYILHILLSLICEFAISRKNDAFVAKIENTLLTKIFMAIFAPDERLPSSATLAKYMTELYCSKQSCLLLVVILYGFTQERYFTDTTTTQRITTTLGRGMRILFRLNCHNKKITYLSFLFFLRC